MGGGVDILRLDTVGGDRQENTGIVLLAWTGFYRNRSSVDHQVQWCRHRRPESELSELFDMA